MAQQLEYRVTAVFRDVADAAAAYCWLRGHFEEAKVGVLLSEKDKESFRSTVLCSLPAPNRPSTPGSEASGAAGVAMGAGALALVGLALSGVGLVAAGPLAAALAGGTVGAMVGSLVGGLVGYGFPEASAKAYAGFLENGGVAVGVLTHDQQQVDLVRQQFQQLRGEQILVI